MPHRYRELSRAVPFTGLRPFHALRERWREGYTAADFRSDAMAGAIVGMVAVPLAMALAIASGVAPQNGLYTVIVAGAVVALLGGSRCQVTGPTAAFVVVLAPVAEAHGLAGLTVAGLMAGVLLILMGVARLGRLIQFIPYPVTTGFTAGIAVVIATIQLKDFLGLAAPMPEHYLERVGALWGARGTWSPVELGIGATTLALLLLWPRVHKRIPAPLVALGAVTVGTVVMRRYFPALEFATVGSRFGGIPSGTPPFALPWTLPGAAGSFTLDGETLRALVPSAFAIAMLGAIESLLSAVVADGMSGTKHDPDAELVALGVGNVLCPFFGGIAATGAIARTATNIRFGARSPLSAVIHSLFALLVVWFLASYMSLLPMAALAGLLMLVAYNMSEAKHFGHILRVSPRSDVIVLLLCFGLTVLFDMVVGVTVGVVLASLLFMRRMAEHTTVRLLGKAEGEERAGGDVPRGVVVYEIGGPLFFGAANRAVEAIGEITDDVRCVIFDMTGVPTMDVTGLVALESALKALHRRGARCILAGVQPQPMQLLTKAGVLEKFRDLELAPAKEEALRKAEGGLTRA